MKAMDTATAPPTEAETDKAFATVAAEGALAGLQVHALAHGYLVCRWNLAKALPDLGATRQFIRQVAGAKR